MPATLITSPGRGEPSKIDTIIKQITKGGPNSLPAADRVFVASIFRAAATIQNRPDLYQLRDRLSAAYLEFCFRIPSTSRNHPPQAPNQ